ncbi:MAG TPA: hypothetical protein VM537_29005 [Anaerolineae bacterium]|nr:hypothetical protein [Anaerolineae bacterium]
MNGNSFSTHGRKYRKDKDELRLKIDAELKEKLETIAASRDSVLTRLVRRYLREGVARDLGPAAASQRMPRRGRPTEEGKHETRGYGTVPFQVDRTSTGYALYEAEAGYSLETDVSEKTACDLPRAA